MLGVLLSDGESEGTGERLGMLLMVGACVGIGVGGHRLLQQEHETPSGGQSVLKKKRYICEKCWLEPVNRKVQMYESQ